jgi:hypothetical protein
MKKNIFICVVVLAVMVLAPGDLSAKNSFKKTQFTLCGGLNMFRVNGADSDYLTGINDFPVTPAYNAPAFGIGLTFFISPSFAVGFDVRYGFSAKVDLRDPSDGETIQADAPKNLIAEINLFQHFNLSKQMQLFISLGGGGEYRMVEEKEYMSNLGNKIIISAPAKPISPLAAAGIGLQYMFSNALGINLECRVTYIIRDPYQILVSPALALVLKF